METVNHIDLQVSALEELATLLTKLNGIVGRVTTQPHPDANYKRLMQSMQRGTIAEMNRAAYDSEALIALNERFWAMYELAEILDQAELTNGSFDLCETAVANSMNILCAIKG